MPASIPKVYSSANAAAPVINGQPQSRQQQLRACLVTGYGNKSVQSLSVTAGVGTAVYAGGHPYIIGDPFRLQGASNSALNADFAVQAVSANTVSFAAPGIADGVVSGTVTSLVAPAGWLEVWAVGAVSVFKPSDPSATGMYLRVDDADPQFTLVQGYESMTDAMTGVGRFPLLNQMGGLTGLVWPKSSASDTSARPWRLFADSRALMLYTEPNTTDLNLYAGQLFGFGDFVAYKAGDAYGAFVSGGDVMSTNVSTSEGDLACTSTSVNSKGLFMPRSYVGVGSSVMGNKMSPYSSSSNYSGSQNYGLVVLPYPNAADNSLRVTPVELIDGESGFRGRLPGVFHTPQRAGMSFKSGEIIDGQGELVGKKLMALRCGGSVNTQSNSVVGVAFVLINAPWRE